MQMQNEVPISLIYPDADGVTARDNAASRDAIDGGTLTKISDATDRRRRRTKTLRSLRGGNESVVVVRLIEV